MSLYKIVLFLYFLISSDASCIDDPLQYGLIRNIKNPTDRSNFLSFVKGKTHFLKPNKSFYRSISPNNILIRSDCLVFFLYRSNINYVTLKQCQIVNDEFIAKFKGQIYSINKRCIKDISKEIFHKNKEKLNQAYRISSCCSYPEFFIEQEISLAFSSLKPWKYKPWRSPQLYTIGCQSNWVYQRDCIIHPQYLDLKSGKTNLQLMKEGRAPISIDGFPVNLHHIHQTPSGPLAEVTLTFHVKHDEVTCGNMGTLPSLINRDRFRVWRKNYWKIRYWDFVETMVSEENKPLVMKTRI